MRIDDGAAAKSDVFCPARLRPPERALPPLRLPAQLLSNSLGCVPRDAYRTDLTPLCRWPPIVVTAAPHLVREVLGSERAAYVKPALTKAMLGPLVGDGLLLAEGASWRWQRSMLAPLLRRKAVLAHVPAIAPYVTHRSAPHFQAPDAFVPERFMGDGRPDRRAAFMPFGWGPRRCIGAELALVEGVVLTAMIVRAASFSLAPSTDPQAVARFTLVPRNGIRLIVRTR